MSVLDNPSGHLLSQAMYSISSTDYYSIGVEWVSVNIIYYGWLKQDTELPDGTVITKTYVYVDTGRKSNAMYGITGGEAAVTITFTYEDNTTISNSQYTFSAMVFVNESIKRLKSITISAYVSTTAKSSGGTYFSATASLNRLVTIEHPTSPNIIVNSNASLPNEDNRAKHIYLPRKNIPQGYIIRIKNVKKDLLYIHAGDKIIENGSHSLIYYNALTTGISVSECGFIMTNNAACTLLYDGSRWLINEYYSGARSSYFKTIDYDLGIDPATKPIVNQPVVIADITTTSKYVRLPDPAGPIRQVILISYGSSNNQLYFSAGAAGRTIDGVKYDTVIYRWWGLRPEVPYANAAVTLLSDGSNWYVMSCTDAVSLWWNSTQDDRPTISATHTTVSSSTRTDAITTDGVGLTPANVPASGATIYYIKHGGLCAYENGIVVTTKNGALIGGTTSKRAYLGYRRERSAAAVLATKVGSQPMFFLLSSFEGL